MNGEGIDGRVDDGDDGDAVVSDLHLRPALAHLLASVVALGMVGDLEFLAASCPSLSLFLIDLAAAGFVDAVHSPNSMRF